MHKSLFVFTVCFSFYAFFCVHRSLSYVALQPCGWNEARPSPLRVSIQSVTRLLACPCGHVGCLSLCPLLSSPPTRPHPGLPDTHERQPTHTKLWTSRNERQKDKAKRSFDYYIRIWSMHEPLVNRFLHTYDTYISIVNLKHNIITLLFFTGRCLGVWMRRLRTHDPQARHQPQEDPSDGCRGRIDELHVSVNYDILLTCITIPVFKPYGKYAENRRVRSKASEPSTCCAADKPGRGKRALYSIQSTYWCNSANIVRLMLMLIQMISATDVIKLVTSPLLGTL